MRISTIKLNNNKGERFDGVLLEFVDGSKILIIPETEDYENARVEVLYDDVEKYLYYLGKNAEKNENFKFKIESYMEIDEEQL